MRCQACSAIVWCNDPLPVACPKCGAAWESAGATTGIARSATVGEILQRLYDSEINCRLEWLWQNGFDWELLDGDRNTKRWGTADTMEAAALAMATAAAADFPDSQFSAWWRAQA